MSTNLIDTRVFYRTIFAHTGISNQHNDTYKDALEQLETLRSHTGQYAGYWASVANLATIVRVTETTELMGPEQDPTPEPEPEQPAMSDAEILLKNLLMCLEWENETQTDGQAFAEMTMAHCKYVERVLLGKDTIPEHIREIVKDWQPYQVRTNEPGKDA